MSALPAKADINRETYNAQYWTLRLYAQYFTIEASISVIYELSRLGENTNAEKDNESAILAYLLFLYLNF